MAKNRLNDFDTTASNNSDVAGVGILGTNKPSNLDDAIRALMALLADWREGTSLDDSANFNDPTDSTKVFALSGAEIPTATTRSIDVEGVYQLLLRGSVPRLITAYATAGNHTHTFADSTVKFKLVAVASGGGSGAVDGQGAGTGGSTAGGNSGFYGETAILARADSLLDGDIVIGAVGTAGGSVAPVTAGGDGADLTWSDGTNSFTWKGGKGSAELTATGGHVFGLPLANGASSATLIGTYGLGDPGNTNGTSDAGGIGGSSPWGVGGIPTLAFGVAVAGVVGSGYGAGAAGAASVGVGTNAAGAAGTVGRIEVWEY